MKRIKGRLYYINQNKGLLYKNFTFYSIDLDSGKKRPIAVIPTRNWKRLLGHFRIFARLLRTEPMSVEKLAEGKYVVCCNHSVFLLDEQMGSITLVQSSRMGFSNPLNVCSDGNAVYWGEYGGNANHKEVNIYRLNQDASLETVHTFRGGVIRHVHNIIWDEYNQLFYILTGDLENTAGIYTTDKDWKDVKPVLTGKQQFRAVVGFPYKNGLIYATDSVEEENNLYLLQNGSVSALSSLSGSCIYGAENKTHYFFSSTVESPEGRGLHSLLTYKLGKGIKDRFSHIVTVKKSDLTVEEVLTVKKDIWPLKLFLYGNVMFPKGQQENDNCWCYIMACKGDGNSILLTQNK